RGTTMKAFVVGERPIGQMLEVQIVGDPYSVTVPLGQIERGHQDMATATQERPSRKEMRKLAASLHIDGWESLETESLWKAIVEAQGPAASNGKAKKGKAKSTNPPEEETVT